MTTKDRIDSITKRNEVEQEEDWDELQKLIPFLQFENHWKVKIIPPFHGAIARFTIENGDQYVSVYLDWFNRLAYMSGPYWEVYSRKTGECERFLLNETEQLMAYIKQQLEDK